MNQMLIKNIQAKMKKQIPVIAVGTDDFRIQQMYSAAGADFILLYPTSQYYQTRNRFLAGYLAFDNSNQRMGKMLGELGRTMNDPGIFIGINGSDPFKNDQIIFENIRQSGISGIHNYPSLSLVDGSLGSDLDHLRIGFDRELEFMEKAKENGFVTCGMVTTKRQAIRMFQTGADMLIFYTSLGEKHKKKLIEREIIIENEIKKLKDLTSAVRQISKEIPLLFHSDTIHNIADVKHIIREVKEINGYLLLSMNESNLSQRKIQSEMEQFLDEY